MSGHVKPGPRATHAVIQAHGLAISLARSEALTQEVRDAATKIVLLLEPALEDIAALHDYTDVQEGNIATMCQESLEREQEITRLRTLLARACGLAERYLMREATRHESANKDFIEAAQLKQMLADESMREFTITLSHNEPRVAAGVR